MAWQGNTFDVDRLIELLQAFETFVDVRDSAPLGPAATPAPSSSASTTLRSGTPPPALSAGAGSGAMVVSGGRRTRTRRGAAGGPVGSAGGGGGGRSGSMGVISLPGVAPSAKKSGASEALVFLFSDEGALLREFILVPYFFLFSFFFSIVSRAGVGPRVFFFVLRAARALHCFVYFSFPFPPFLFFSNCKSNRKSGI